MHPEELSVLCTLRPLTHTLLVFYTHTHTHAHTNSFQNHHNGDMEEGEAFIPTILSLQHTHFLFLLPPVFHIPWRPALSHTHPSLQSKSFLQLRLQHKPIVSSFPHAVSHKCLDHRDIPEHQPHPVIQTLFAIMTTCLCGCRRGAITLKSWLWQASGGCVGLSESECCLHKCLRYVWALSVGTCECLIGHLRLSMWVYFSLSVRGGGANLSQSEIEMSHQTLTAERG